MDWQDLTVGIITALCAVLFLKHLFFPRRRKSGRAACSCGKDAARSGKSHGTMKKKCPDFSGNVACQGCPFCCEAEETEARRDKNKG